jgi:hypothetical protein
MRRFALVAFCLLTSGCGFAPEPLYGRGDEAPSQPFATDEELKAIDQEFAEIKDNVIEPYCLRCHNSNNSRGHVDLSTLAAIRSNSRIVQFGNPDKSLFYITILEGLMPPKGDPLSLELTEKVRLWIERNQ